MVMNNVLLRYLYRDAGNYRNDAKVVFSNPDRISVEFAVTALRKAFMADGLFIAHQIRIPNAFLFAERCATSDDHCFHEFENLEKTAELPDDSHGRSITAFVREAQTQSKVGWAAFDPHDYPLSQRIA